ncbi:hypothetical protein EE612_029045, partial [Oryza sativa]
SLRSDPLPRAS